MRRLFFIFEGKKNDGGAHLSHFFFRFFPFSHTHHHHSHSVVLACLETARAAGAYKTILDCSEANTTFYEKAGLSKKEVQMVKYH